VIAAADLLIMLGARWFFEVRGLPRDVHLAIAGVILLAIFFFALRRLIKLRGGGEAIAKMVKARPVKRNTTEPAEKRLLNIVDEMAIASGVAAPCAYVMDKEEGINAFAAGYSPNQAVIVVTQGALAKLNRDELQGVIGHEFSHILNGDMRLNVRLIGILAGIVIVGEAGLVIIKLGAEAGDTGAIPFILWGALVAAVGYIGVFFGRMIKAAVSRQREFLADASSVQFTRNPDGLVSALGKIRDDNKVISNGMAGEMCHMYFSQSFNAKMFKEYLATHPPIEERIASITGRKAEARAAGADVVAMVGQSSPEHVERATELVGAIPEVIKAQIDTPEGACSVVYGYLGSGDAADAVRKLDPALRLPVLTLALPALAQMERRPRADFLRKVDELIDADNKVTLGEFTLRTILQRQLARSATRVERVKYKDLASIRPDLDLLLSMLASAESDKGAQQAVDAKSAGEALDRLRVLAPLEKPKVIHACVKAAMADDKINVTEMELLRAIGMAIDCPLPPALESA
jgi:Zn-dependent protease with chaperone function